ncbi:MAG: 50S ribosomal protein L24 [Nanoarchaeota archaeon]
MSSNRFSTSWKRSTQQRKQHLYRYNAPLHLRQKLTSVHLSPELRKKYVRRSLSPRKGDKVKILRGKFAKREGKIERILLKRERIYITGMENIKKDGTKLPAAFPPSHLMLIELDLNDKYRKQKLEKRPLTK